MSQITLIPRDKLSGVLNYTASKLYGAANLRPTDYTVSSEKELLALEPDKPMVTVRMGRDVIGVLVTDTGDRAYLWPCRNNAIATALLPEAEMAVLQPKVKQCYIRQTGATI